MARPGQVITNPRRKETVTFVHTARDSAGKLLEMTVVGAPELARPPLHVHDHQEERFLIHSGVLTYQLGNQVKQARSGDTLTVPAGTPHTWWNAGEVDVEMVGYLEPALRFETFIETIYGLTRDGKVSATGRPSLLQAAVIFDEFRNEWALAQVPRPVQRILFPLLAWVGRRRGLRPWYPAYSPDGPVTLPR